jgi:hypothetical protein
MTKQTKEVVTFDDAGVSAIEVRLIRDALRAVYDRRQQRPPQRSEKENEPDFEVRKAWWTRGQNLLLAIEDVVDGELLFRLAKGVVTNLDYNTSNNLCRALMANLTFQYRRVVKGAVANEAAALEKAKHAAGHAAVETMLDDIFAGSTETYPNEDEFFASMTEQNVRYVVEQLHSLLAAALGRMYQRDLENARQNNAPNPYSYESLPFTSVAMGRGEFVGQYSLDDAMNALDVIESERASNAMEAIASKGDIIV